MEAGSLGLREPGELPGDEVYRAHLANYLVAEQVVPLEAVVPISPLQTAEEITAWEAEEASKRAAASRRGVQFGKDPRDMKSEPEQVTGENEVEAAQSDEAAEAVSVHSMPAKSTPEELATAERVLRSHSRYIKPVNKRML